ncbi:hypothetical protein ACFX19_024171 [Malus domestica]
MANPHVLVIPYPAQGHVIPLSELSRCLAKHDRAKPGKFSAAIAQVTPGKFEELIEQINGGNGNQITCVLADQSLGWALEISK